MPSASHLPTPEMKAHTLATESSATKEVSHFQYIDALRGWAFLSVLAVHVQGQLGDFRGRWLFASGGYGVQLFFLLSAITLCYSMASRKRSDRFPIMFFYLRRLFRIAPMFWLAILVYGVFHTALFPTRAVWAAPSGITPSYYVLTALFMHGWNPYTFNSIVPGGWSIAVEMNFYLLFPFLYRWLGTSPKRAMACVLLCLIYGWLMIKPLMHLHHHFFMTVRDGVLIFFLSEWLISQLPVFLIGIFVYHVLQRSQLTRLVRDRFWSWSLLVIVAFVLVSVLRQFSTGLIQAPVFIVFSLATGVIATSGNLPTVIVNRATRYMGKISYSAYLMHFAALRLASSLLGGLNPSNGNLILFVETYVVTLVLTAVVATVTYHLIEEPGRKLGIRLLALVERRYANSLAAT